jgi:hypothetical protein
MKRVIRILLALYCFNATALFAQDVITLKSGEEIKAKVQEISSNDVKYKKHESPDGPTYTLPKSDIFMIKYENGEKDIFKDTEPKPQTQTQVRVQVTDPVVTDPLRYNVLGVKNHWWHGKVVTDINGKRLSGREVRSLMADTPSALAEYKWGVSDEVFGNIFGVGGASFLVLGIVYIIETGDVDDGGLYALTSMGLASLGLAAYLITKAGSHKATAVSIYNNAKRNTSSLQLNFGVTRSGGVGLTLNF